MLELLKKLLRDEEGPTAIEYVLMVTGVAVLILAAVWFFGGNVSSKFDEAAQKLQAR
jgi:pilus assembly protein Flp/PilA